MKVGDLVEITKHNSPLLGKRGIIRGKSKDWPDEWSVNIDGQPYHFPEDKLDLIISTVDTSVANEALDGVTGTRDPDEFLKEQTDNNLQGVFG